MAYTYEELISAYSSLGVGKGRVVYVTSDLGRLMAFEKPGKQAVLEAHYKALSSLVGEDGTLVVPSASMNLCNTDIPFDLQRTPSFKVGVLSEFVRQKKGALRGFHPFVSYTAIGAKAEQITQNVSRYAYGFGSPMARMLECDALSVSIGLYPYLTCSSIHHAEQMMTVPYRYTKEWVHPVIRNGEVVDELFYMYVWYKNSDIKRNFVKWIYKDFIRHHEIKEVEVGRGKIYSYSTREFVDHAMRMFLDDPYIWCEAPPKIRPWRK